MFSTRVVTVLFCALTFVNVSQSGESQHKASFLKLATCQEYDIESTSCQHYFPVDVFKNHRTDEYKLYLKFYVMTGHDANIVLSSSLKKSDIQYIIVVGGGGNTYSWLRNGTDTTVGLDSRMVGILSPLWPATIIVRQKYGGQLEVAVPGVADPLLRAEAADLEVQSVCLFAWDNQSRWFYNCSDQEDHCLAIRENCAQPVSNKSQ
ncbi:uncharacterized protein LOC119657218 [Hermetia illucens]|nr:uncharacterized protein LOC119657218 [Hermetia illucens]XP_037919958.1 uncharacterized protein LOC119657218 [Hermetia illucens]